MELFAMSIANSMRLPLFLLPYYQTMSMKFFLLAWILALAACNNEPSASTSVQPSNGPAVINYSVVNAYPHDTNSFTEGLLVHEGQLYESTGHTSEFSNSRSLFGALDLKTGKISVKAELDSGKYFGEGIAFLNGKVYQLTLSTKVGFIYDARTFKKLGEFPLPVKEGWGMTTNGRDLIISDGTSNISYVDPKTFQVNKVLSVSDNNGLSNNINELELINGYLYANQWLTNYILRIDTVSGKVIGRIDLSSLKQEANARYPDAIETNGIAYDSANKKIYVTGKFWPNIYEIQFGN
jgi:glutamine cyclotransferase